MWLPDVVQAMIQKSYLKSDGRTFSTDIESFHERGLLSRSIHWNTVLNYLRNPDLTAHLESLIALSSLPMLAIETRGSRSTRPA